MQLAWLPVQDATADHALKVLKSLVAQHGLPLVLKSDNGSAFVHHRFQNWLQDNAITTLFSPVATPSYNGACEAGIGGMKQRTLQLSARDDRMLQWTSDDLYGAQLWANEYHYPYGLAAGTPAERFAARLTVTDEERALFRALVLQHEASIRQVLCSDGYPMTDKLSALCHRRAVRHALVERGYLTITQRSIPQPIKSAKCA
jgi:transposase InsO family protein